MSEPWPDLPRGIVLNGQPWGITYLWRAKVRFHESIPAYAYAYADRDVHEIIVCCGTERRPYPLRRVLEYLFHELCHASFTAWQVEEEVCQQVGKGVSKALAAEGFQGKPKRARKE